MGKFFEIIKYFIERLSSKPVVGGLEISDSALRFVSIKGDGQIQTFGVKIPPGILKEGKIESPEKFLEILKNLHELIKPKKSASTIQTVVALPSNLIYTQSFIVPNIGKDQFEETALLNLKTISPISPDQGYMSWQTIKDSENSFELLGAVSEKTTIDQYKNLFEIASFYPVAFEFPALSFGRVIGKMNIEKNRPLFLLWISSCGLGISSYIGDALYFDYFKSWGSIQGGERQIQRSVFEETLVQEIQRFINFTLGRFQGNFKEIYFLVPGFETEIKNLLENRLKISAFPLILSSYSSLSPVWYAALGSAIRGSIERYKDHFLNLNPESSVKMLYRERLLDLIHVWRNVLAGVLFSLLLITSIAAAYFVRISRSVASQLASFKSENYTPEFASLVEKSREFNDLVLAIKRAKSQEVLGYRFFADILEISRQNQVVLDALEIVSVNSPVTIVAHAPDSETVIRFKNALAANQMFFNINLPISRITLLEDSSVSFSLSFQVKK